MFNNGKKHKKWKQILALLCAAVILITAARIFNPSDMNLRATRNIDDQNTELSVEPEGSRDESLTIEDRSGLSSDAENVPEKTNTEAEDASSAEEKDADASEAADGESDAEEGKEAADNESESDVVKDGAQATVKDDGITKKDENTDRETTLITETESTLSGQLTETLLTAEILNEEGKQTSDKASDAETKTEITLEGAMPEGAVATARQVEADIPDANTIAAYNLTVSDGKDDFQPEEKNAIAVTITDEQIKKDADLELWQIKEDGEKEQIHDITVEDGQIQFQAEALNTFAIVETTLEKNVLASDGKNYKISVTYGPDAGFPKDADLDVREIVQKKSNKTTEYDKYMEKTQEALGWEDRDISYARFFDINIVDGNGKNLQPAEGSKVSVEIRLDDKKKDAEPQVVHFGKETEVLEAQTEGKTVAFDTTGFSVYAIVDAPEPVGDRDVATLKELSQNTGKGFFLSYKEKAQYISSDLNKKSCFVEVPDSSSAAVWYFEPIEEKDNQYYIFTMVGDVKKYIRQTEANNNNVTLAVTGTAFELSETGSGSFFIKHAGEKRWLQHSGSGGGIRFYTDINNTTNSSISLTYASSAVIPDDPFKLSGKTYGLAYHNDSAAAAALMGNAKDASHLAAKEMLMRPDVLDNDGILLVAANSDITEWTFRSESKNHYYITTIVDGVIKYLTLNGQALTLEDTKSSHALFTVQSGTDMNAGKYQLSVGNYKIGPDLSGNNADKGFRGTTDKTASWLNLVEKSVLNDDDFNRYEARKVSVSDTSNVYDYEDENGKRHQSQVIIYTRIWNDTTKKYEFYAVDHDGSLVRCYDTGDGIEWIGSQVNTALWTFTEYHNGDGTPNYYYELQNVQYGNYIAPQLTGNQVLSKNTLGVNLNGRRYGENYTTIIAWDDDSYAYSGLKTANGRVVACPLAEAEDFYFAVVDPAGEDADALTTVKTIDSDQYGITMKMIDFNNKIVNERDSVQHGFFGSHSNNYEQGLLSTSLNEDGYPSTTSRTGHEAPLSDLFKDMTDVNHLFIQSIFNESGYFEYDSTSNFAHLNKDGNFTVYDQLGAIGTPTGPTRTHGQFMPYNDLVPGDYAVDSKGNLITNQTDVLAKELPDTDPRKGEKLYRIPQDKADYFFGMEMGASFTQTANGLDAWGHDIIFEFSGDDDFWLYVDGELVLDLGGVRSALTGSVNFRTGEVINAGTKTTLYDVFKKNYQARGLSQTEINKKLGEIFVKSSEGNYTFKDYTNHTMKMFYMERGAGASNLHMRFNLAAVKPGTVVLSKKLSGTDNPANDLIEFPYQIHYATKEDGGTSYHLLEEKTEETYNVTYKGTINPVPYKDRFTPAGTTTEYQNVFFIKPGQSAVIDLPDDTVSYYITECGVNPTVFDEVKANGEILVGRNDTAPKGTRGDGPDENAERKNYSTSAASMEVRPEVDFDNHVSDGAMRTLTLSKKLYDSDGQTVLNYSQDAALFRFRLYLGTENADADNLPLADLYPYYIKDPEGNYCRWNAQIKRFQSLNITEYAELKTYLDGLTPAEQETVRFATSMNGSITRIPADYSVEIRDLLVGTQYKAEERDSEIPKGYTLRLEDGYTRVDGEKEEKHGTTPFADTIKTEEDPAIQVRNQKGWGLTVEKVWTDADFMETHDPIYFAVYVKNGDGAQAQYSLLDGSVRELKTTESSIYYFFGNLQSGTPFADYTVYEVRLKKGNNFKVDKNGVVTGFDSIEQIEEGGELVIGGKPVGGEYHAATPDGYSYTVKYDPGEQTTQNENVRTDTVTNSRPGIELYKTDWNGTPLAGAVFTLQDAKGKDVAAPAYTSRTGDGLITIAYLSQGTYTLTETEALNGYVVLENPMTITVGETDAQGNTSVTVSGIEESYYTVSHDNKAMAATITIKNRASAFQVKKIDSDTGEPIPDVHFALYHQVTNNQGDKVKDYRPMTGFEDLITDENGVLGEITMALGAGTYYLTETIAANDYDLLNEDLCFTIGKDGRVSIETKEHKSWLKQERDPETGETTYSITIPNGKMKTVSFKKVDFSEPDKGLEGAVFDLYAVVDGTQADTPLYANMTSDANGMLVCDGVTELSIPMGTYNLVETKAPSGYNTKEEPVVLNVTASEITCESGEELAKKKDWLTYDEDTGVYLIKLSDISGTALPSTGGMGTTIFMILGGILVALAGATLLIRTRKR